MIQHTNNILAEVGLGFFALAVCASTLPAQSTPETPGSAALLIVECTGVPDGWDCPSTLWLDGVEYSGTGSVEHDGVMDDFSWHGTEIQPYDFGQLGTFQLSAISRTTFDVVESGYRWHTYTGTGRITEGTGAFAKAQGILEIDGYTRWFTDGSAPPAAWYSAPGRIYGVSAIPEPMGPTLVSIGVAGLFAATRRQRQRAR